MRRGIVVGRLVGTLLLVVTFADSRSAVGLAAERGQLFIDDHEWSLEESPLHLLADCSFKNRAVQTSGVSELLI